MCKGKFVKDPRKGVFEGLEIEARLTLVFRVRIRISVVKDNIREPTPIFDRQIVAVFFLADQVDEDLNTTIRGSSRIFRHHIGPTPV